MVGAAVACVSLAACGSDGGSNAGAAGNTGLGGSPQAAAGAPVASAGAGTTAAGAGNSAGNPAAGGAPASQPGGAGSSAAGSGTAGSGAAGAPATSACIGDAKYKVTVNVTWADAAVNSKHYTTIIGGVHSASVSLWKLGGTATDGIKSMAEAGGTMLLGDEVGAAVKAGSAKVVIKFGGGNAPGSSTGMVDVSPQFPLVSFGSMLAPTPDWFVGVSSLSLCEGGAWLTSKKVDALVYDAGTKDGADFDYGFPETQPRAPIGYAVKFAGNVPAGTIELVKQ